MTISFPQTLLHGVSLFVCLLGVASGGGGGGSGSGSSSSSSSKFTCSFILPSVCLHLHGYPETTSQLRYTITSRSVPQLGVVLLLI